MARPREFEMDTALANAMDVFWAHGYEETSMPQLLEGMSLSRGSLYKAFTDKRSLFMLVLKKYEKDAVSPAVSLLKDQSIPDGSDRIKKLFQMVLDTVENGDHRGCLLCTTAAGSASNDDEIAATVHRLLGDMRGGFTSAVDQSNALGGYNSETRAKFAGLLLTQYVGLRVLVRSTAPKNLLQESFASLLHVIGK